MAGGEIRGVNHASAERFVSAAIAGLHPLIRQWVTAEDLRIRLHTHVEGIVRGVDDRNAAREFRSRVPVAGAAVDDYLPRVIAIGGDEVLAGGFAAVFPPAASSSYMRPRRN